MSRNTELARRHAAAAMDETGPIAAVLRAEQMLKDLQAEIDDLIKANRLLHGLLSNRDAEIERLRAALADIASYPQADARELKDIAREVLNGTRADQ